MTVPFVPGYVRYRDSNVQVTEVWSSQAQLPFLLGNAMALWLLCSVGSSLPSPSSRPRSGHPLVLIHVWNPVEELKTVIRGLGLRSHPQPIPSLHSDSGPATELVWPFDNDTFDVVICEALGGGGSMHQGDFDVLVEQTGQPPCSG